MKTQISRNSRQASKNYSSVCHQQGRMLTDSDLTEQALLTRDRLSQALQDVIGSGTPRFNALLQLTLSGNTETPTLHWGRVYVDGVPAEVMAAKAAEGEPVVDPEMFEYDHQLLYPEAPALPTASAYRLYLDVWERAVTWLEDEKLRDPGLHGADTTTRTQTMAQVKWCDIDTQPLCPQVNPQIGDAQLQLILRSLSSDIDKCDPCSEELDLNDPVGNYLFRVELHDVHYNDPLPPAKRDKDNPVLADRITLKWSSENGAEAYKTTDVPPDFISTQFVYEFFNDTNEKHLGNHLAREVSNERIIDGQRDDLLETYPATPPAEKNYVRRWDGFCKLIKVGNNWQLDSGFEGSLELKPGTDNPGTVIQGGDSVTIELRMITMLIDLADNAMLCGDYWTAPVRETIHQQGDILLQGEEVDTGALPQGELHHYMLLVDIAADGNTMTLPEGVQCDDDNACQLAQFPNLTDLRADDICLDNKICSMPDVHTVQDAINHLCQENDLPRHNKYLHGWGIVCGLMLECDRENPQSVNLKPGYALDCEGRDMDIKQNFSINIPEYLKKAQIDPTQLDQDQGFCLYLEHTDKQTLDVGIELYKPDQSTLVDRLRDTLLIDFYQDCIVDLFDTLKGDMDETDVKARCAISDCGKELIPPLKRRTLALTNLVFHKNQQEANTVLNVSPCEHFLFKDLYDKLNDHLSSRTFCGQFQQNGFPDYPFKENNCRATWFTPELMDHLRLHPNGRLILGWQQNSSRIYIFEQSKKGCTGDLIGHIDISQAENGDITDLFIDEKNIIHLTAIIHQEDTLFARGKLDINKIRKCSLGIKWETSFICGVKIVRIKQSPWSRKHLFAVALCQGVYAFSFDEIFKKEKIEKEPDWAFKASGHIDFEVKSDQVFATVFSMDDKDNKNEKARVNINVNQTCAGGFYNSIAVFNGKSVDKPEPAVIVKLLLNRSPVSGVDGFILKSSTGLRNDGLSDARINLRATGFVLFLVINEGTNKILCRFENKKLKQVNENFWQWSGIKHHAFGDAGHVALSTIKNKKLDGILASRFKNHDLQYIPANSKLYDKNLLESIPVQAGPIDIVNTNSKEQIFVLNHFGQSISALNYNLPVYHTERAKLARYRDDVIKAFYQLLTGLLQYLKDCFCQHLLVDCPECNEDEKVYLGCLSMDGNNVHNICNFTKRKYVKSFPTVSYWLSLIPVAPIVGWLVEQFCCLVLPDFSSNTDERSITVSPFQVGMSKAIINADQTNMLSEITIQGQSMVQQGLTSLVGTGYKDKKKYEELTMQEYNYKPGVYAAKTLKMDNQLMQQKIQAIDEGQTIHEESVTALKDQLSTLETENKTSEARIISLESDKQTAQQEVNSLKTELDKIQLEKTGSDNRLIQLEADLADLKLIRQEIKPIIEGAQPVSSIEGISIANVKILQDNNINDVKTLANTDTTALRKLGMQTRTATSLVKKANDRINLII